jgi:hypothetical protein
MRNKGLTQDPQGHESGKDTKTKPKKFKEVHHDLHKNKEP